MNIKQKRFLVTTALWLDLHTFTITVPSQPENDQLFSHTLQYIWIYLFQIITATWDNTIRWKINLHKNMIYYILCRQPNIFCTTALLYFCWQYADKENDLKQWEPFSRSSEQRQFWVAQTSAVVVSLLGIRLRFLTVKYINVCLYTFPWRSSSSFLK